MVLTAPDVMHTPESSSASQEAEARAAIYGLLAAFLSSEPSRAHLDAAADLSSGPSTHSPFSQALQAFGQAASQTSPADASDAYFNLFIGVGRGLLVPYASYYLTGFLNEKPLARLRQDMGRLGIERDPSVKEPEDHIASELEVMAGILRGEFAVPSEPAHETAKSFFENHLATWSRVFFSDLATTDTLTLYTTLGELGREFIALESAALDYAA